MADVLAENLSDKSVVGADGTEIGPLHNITMDLQTGSLGDLLVEPNEEYSAGSSPFGLDEDGLLHVPVARVQAVKDYIVVES
jgi:sporulation protein YlmC with PRC-barrel domain